MTKFISPGRFLGTTNYRCKKLPASCVGYGQDSGVRVGDSFQVVRSSVRSCRQVLATPELTAWRVDWHPQWWILSLPAARTLSTRNYDRHKAHPLNNIKISPLFIAITKSRDFHFICVQVQHLNSLHILGYIKRVGKMQKAVAKGKIFTRNVQLKAEERQIEMCSI